MKNQSESLITSVCPMPSRSPLSVASNGEIMDLVWYKWHTSFWSRNTLLLPLREGDAAAVSRLRTIYIFQSVFVHNRRALSLGSLYQFFCENEEESPFTPRACVHVDIATLLWTLSFKIKVEGQEVKERNENWHVVHRFFPQHKLTKVKLFGALIGSKCGSTGAIVDSRH